MNKAQRIVGLGAASGVAIMAASVWLITLALPAPTITEALSERLAYALHANVCAVIPLFVMLVYIANARFRSEAIDPTKHLENRAMEIDGRVADNTLQQNVVFFIATLALSTVVPIEWLQILWALAIVFIATRCAFWIGYRINPLYRAPEMAATAYMNLGVILYTLYKIFF
jgi:hypothetical protein